MSHIVTITTQVKDQQAVIAACSRLHLPALIQGVGRLFSGQAEGLLVQLPDWKYLLVCNTAEGRLHFDNYGGRWGAQQELDRFLQAYACEKVKLEARQQRRSVW